MEPIVWPYHDSNPEDTMIHLPDQTPCPYCRVNIRPDLLRFYDQQGQPSDFTWKCYNCNGQLDIEVDTFDPAFRAEPKYKRSER